MATTRHTASLARFVTEYEDQSEEELVIPENLGELSAEELEELSARANEAFDALYGDGSAEFSDDDLATLADLAEGIEALAAETQARQEAAAERAEQAAQLAARVRGNADEQDVEETLSADTTTDGDDEDVDEGDEAEDSAEEDEEPASGDENAAQTVTASASEKAPARRRRIPMSAVQGRRSAPAQSNSEPASSVSDIMFAATDGAGVVSGQGVDWSQLSTVLDHRLTSFNVQQYRTANQRGMHMREQHALAVIKRDFPEELRVTEDSVNQVERAIKFATDEARLPGGSLVAAGGWCAPSETTYELLNIGASRDGLLSVPEINVTRGGIRWPITPSFADIYTNIAGFSYTEEEDIDGDYDGEGGGSKPCYHIDCPEWDEIRLGVDGLCITAGLLQRRGYPEYLQFIVQNALVAHDHRLNAAMIAQMESGSDEVTMPSGQAGTTAPLLTSIELQVEHYRYSHRLSRGTSLEAVFPFWVRGAVRADLARRQGVDLLAVTDAQIDGWFRSRGVNPQFVYNWQALEGDAETVTAFPNEVKFLLYSAGTWVRGADSIITLDTLYDSTLLGTNDFTALFTEEAWFVAKRGLDSRVVTVEIEANGATHAGVAIEHNGVGGPIEVSGLAAEEAEEPEASE